MLPEWGADVNTDNEAGQSALCLAAEAGHHHILSLLLQCGARLDRPERTVRAAARGGNMEVVRFLLDTLGETEEAEAEKSKKTSESCLATVALVTAAAHRQKQVRYLWGGNIEQQQDDLYSSWWRRCYNFPQWISTSE